MKRIRTKQFRRTGGTYGCRVLTGGGNEFYKKIGYDAEMYTYVYKKV